ncbi:unnamed protein product [Calicophoron daubneyi]
MSISNAVARLRFRLEQPVEETSSDEEEAFRAPTEASSTSVDRCSIDEHNIEQEELEASALCRSPEFFSILQKFELSQMFSIYFGRIGNFLFYLVMCIYLYGDLAVYAAAVAKSLRDVVCIRNVTGGILSDADICFSTSTLTRMDVYRIFLLGFIVCMCPFLFFHVTKSRWLQLTTAGIRWFTYLLLICLAIDRAIVLRTWSGPDPPEPVPYPTPVRASGIPTLFGIAVYVFMCHHSLPGVITPIRNKHRLNLRVIFPLFLTILGCNLLLSGTAVAGFNNIKDLYTLNFVPDEHSYDTFKIPYLLAQIFGYFISLFPVFALSSAFPIISTTLLGNIRTLFSLFKPFQTDHAQKVLRYVLPFVVAIPPCAVSLGVNDISFLVNFTGAFAGSGIQYIIPAVLVYRARRYLYSMLHPDVGYENFASTKHGDEEPLYPTNVNSLDPASRGRNLGCCERLAAWWRSCAQMKVVGPHSSIFQHILWVIFILVWAIFCIVFVLVDKIYPF